MRARPVQPLGRLSKTGGCRRGSGGVISRPRSLPTACSPSLCLMSYATGRAGRCHGPQDDAHDIARESSRVRLQLCHRLLLILFQLGACVFDLFLGARASLVRGIIAVLIGLLTARFLIFEYFLSRFAE